MTPAQSRPWDVRQWVPLDGFPDGWWFCAEHKAVIRGGNMTQIFRSIDPPVACCDAFPGEDARLRIPGIALVDGLVKEVPF
jgi:hypothetical protein